MDKIYLERRQGDNYTSYRMNSRAGQIINFLSNSAPFGSSRILDAGAAEGRMLSLIAKHFNFKHAFGIDIFPEAISAASGLKDERMKVFNADLRQLPFKAGVFDVVLVCAVLEHIKDIDSAMREFYRVLQPGGLLCVTLPNPAYDLINGLLVKTYHVRRYRLARMKELFVRSDFLVLDSEYFMVFPFYRLPFEGLLLRLIRRLNLDFLLFNYIIIGRKQVGG